jgi:hypothetical protein
MDSFTTGPLSLLTMSVKQNTQVLIHHPLLNQRLHSSSQQQTHLTFISQVACSHRDTPGRLTACQPARRQTLG